MALIINFIWQSIICLSFFYACYWVFLKGEKTFVFNRIYLIITPFLAIAFSIIEIPVSFEKPSISLENTAFLKAFEINNQNETIGTFGLPEVTVTGSRLPTLWVFTDYLILGYLAIVLFLFARFYWQFLQLKQILRRGWYQTTFVLKDNYFKIPNFGMTPVFSYFDKIFWDDDLALSKKEITQILNHEIEHVKQRHTYDIIIYQILSNVFWFNPILHLMKRELIDLHEFQADASVIKDTALKDSYPKLVAKMAFQGLDLSIGSYFIRSTTLKRIQMMKANRKTNWFKLAMLIPLMFMLFGLVSMKTNSAIISLNNYSTLPVSFLKNQIVSFQDSIAVGIKLKNVKNPTHYESIGKLQDESLNVQIGELSYEFTGIKNKQEYHKVLGLVESLRPNSTLNKKYENAYHYYNIVQKPEPKIGWEAWEKHLTSQIPEALKSEIQINGGTVELEFIVDHEAKVINPTIKKSLGEEVDQILLTSLTNHKESEWIPGKQDDRNVAVVVNAKIKLQNQEPPIVGNLVSDKETFHTHSKAFPENLAVKINDDLNSGAIVLGAPFKQHLSKSLAFPKGAIASGVSGTSILKLKTDSSGEINDLSFVQRINPTFENAIMKALENAPNLKPVLQKNVYELLLPITFKIYGASANKITPNLFEDYGDVININGYKAQENPMPRDPFNSPLEIPVHIIKAGLVSFDGVTMPINSGLSEIIKAYVIHNAIKPQLAMIKFSAGKEITMGSVQNVQSAIKKAGFFKFTFNKEATKLVSHQDKTPLYIIDGVIQLNPKDMDYPNPENIESISVVNQNKLHLYGEKAKFGAIIIKTK